MKRVEADTSNLTCEIVRIESQHLVLSKKWRAKKSCRFSKRRGAEQDRLSSIADINTGTNERGRKAPLQLFEEKKKSSSTLFRAVVEVYVVVGRRSESCVAKT